MSKPSYATVGDAIVTELNDSSRVWAGQFTAKRVYLAPEYKPEELQRLKVVVAPSQSTQELVTRNKRDKRHQIDIAFRQEVNPEDVTTIDTLAEIVEQVADYYGSGSTGGKRKIAGTEATVTDVAISPLFAPDDMAKHRRFLSIVELSILQQI